MFSFLSVCSRVRPHVTITHALDLTVQGPVEFKLFKLVHWGPPNPYWHLLAEAHTVGKQAVRILLECFRGIGNSIVLDYFYDTE